MANPPTQPDVQTVAGATQFDGLTGTTGLLNFAAIVPATTQDKRVRVKVKTISYFATGAAHDLLVLASSGGAATERIELINSTGILSRVQACDFVMPKTVGGPVSWNLVVTTTGKTNTATLLVDWIVLFVD